MAFPYHEAFEMVAKRAEQEPEKVQSVAFCDEALHAYSILYVPQGVDIVTWILDGRKARAERRKAWEEEKRGTQTAG